MMNKKEIDMLEKIFACEIEGRMYQGKSKLLIKLVDEGYVTAVKKYLPSKLGTITVTGYVLTIAGNYAYCSSDRCVNAEEIA